MSGPRVAIVGGGISGLVCGARLGQLGLKDVTVFDTGRRAPGGRCSSRNVNINGKIHVFDHSAQYFTVSDEKFAKIVGFLNRQGAAKIWNGKVGRLKSGRIFEESKAQMFIGTDGMQSIAQSLATQVKVQPKTWVGNVLWEPTIKRWRVDRYGHFDYLVVAHNGKCADKLMASAGVPDIHKLLRVRFGDRLLPNDQRMQLCSIWCLLVAFPQTLKLSIDGAHVDGITSRDGKPSIISWIANNTQKLQKPSERQNGPECWTIFSTKEFGTANKVPQENIPPKKAEEVTERLLVAFAEVTGLKRGALKPCFTKVQLWGAAVPMNVLDNGEECVFDGMHHVGICGDWLTSPCIEGAAVSGLAVAEKIYKDSQGKQEGTSLCCKFKPTESVVIGAFPTNPALHFNPLPHHQ
ncbi:renalase-like [Lineus longissimus]|uniref:renalase-like n=1 Tax=Lineus longissimus TaxID=88925 RepID=UPI002B4D0241